MSAVLLRSRKKRSLGDERLSLSQKFSRLRERMRDPEWRRFAKLIIGGKLIGLAIILTLVFTVVAISSMGSGAPARADDMWKGTINGPADVINPINTMWTLVAAFLVFCMQ